VWEKPNPPPNLSCRYFTHSTETILWAARNRKSRHHFNYDTMRELNGGKQMKSVWRLTAPGYDSGARLLHGLGPRRPEPPATPTAPADAAPKPDVPPASAPAPNPA